MNDAEKNRAIEAAKAANDLHASHGAMEVSGEADAAGMVNVTCVCGVGLRISMPPAPVVEDRAPRRRVTVNDGDS